MNKEEFKNLVLQCIASPEQYKTNIKAVKEELVKQNKETTKCYLDVILNTILDKKAAPTCRLYALYSLKTFTESSIAALLAELFSRSSALKGLQDQAVFDKDKHFPERGSTFFGSKPKSDQDKKIGSTYLALLLEIIKYWERKYGTTEKGKDNPPRALFKKLSGSLKVPFPEDLHYYKNTQPNASAQQDQNDIQLIISELSGSQNKSTGPVNGRKTSIKENDPVSSAREKLDLLSSLKLKLKEFYDQNKKGLDLQSLKQYYNEMIYTDRQLSDLLSLMLNNSSTKNESLVNEILQQHQQFDIICKEYENLAAGKSIWQTHRSVILVILTGKDVKISGSELDLAQQLFKEARKVNATVVKYNSSNLSGDSDLANVREEQISSLEQKGKFGKADNTNKKVEEEEKIAIVQKTTAALDLNVEKLPGQGENPDFDSTAKLFVEARKKEARIVKTNASQLYEDADNPNSNEEQKVRGRGVEIDKDLKTETKNEIRETGSEQTVVQGEVKPKTQMKVEGRPKTQEDNAVNRKYEEEKKVTNFEDKSLKSGQAGRTSQAQRNEFLNGENLKNNVTESNQENFQKSASEEKKVIHTSNSPINPIPLAQSLTIKTQGDAFQAGETANATKGTFQFMKLDKTIGAQKFSSELKMMERSIRTARARSGEMEIIKEGIKQSFMNRNRNPPKYREILDQGLLKNLENKIEQLKNQEQPLLVGNQVSNPKLDAKEQDNGLQKPLEHELVRQTLSLQNQCGEYQKEVEKVSKENAQLKSDLQQIQLKLTNLDVRSVPFEEVEDLKNNNHALLRQIRLLEDQLKSIQQQSYHGAYKSQSKLIHSIREPQEAQNKAKGGSEENENLKKSEYDLKKQNEQLSSKIATQSENEDYLSENPENRRSSRSGENLIISSKHELIEGKDRLVHEIVINSPSRSYTQQRLGFISPTSQKTSSVESANYFYQKGSWSPREKLFNSAGLVNREENQHLKPGNRYNVESTFESDIEQDVGSILGKQVASEHYVLKELKPRLDVAGNSLYQFKVSCLKSKSLLFENDFMQIGLTTNLVQDYASSKNILKLMVYYGNKLKVDITEFRVALTEGLNLNVMTRPELYESIVPSEKQIKQQFLISFASVPFNCLQLNCEALIAGTRINFCFPLPNLLIKFMEFKYVDLPAFKARWKSLEDLIVKTEPIALSKSLIKRAADFKNHFAYLIDVGALNDNEIILRNTGVKFGGLFELDALNVEYLLKINVLPNSEVVFQIASPKENQALASYLLQTLIFVFRR